MNKLKEKVLIFDMFNSITNTKINSSEESSSHNFEDSNLKVNRNGNNGTSAFMTNPKRKEVKKPYEKQ